MKHFILEIIFFIPRSKEMALVYKIGKKDLENSKFQFQL